MRADWAAGKNPPGAWYPQLPVIHFVWPLRYRLAGMLGARRTFHDNNLVATRMARAWTRPQGQRQEGFRAFRIQ